MATLPAKAKCVVIGAGIVGNSVLYHLARLGWKDLVQIDKGPLPNPGGSTGHASNFIFPVDHSKEMAHITADSMKQYKELNCFTECGGIEVALRGARRNLLVVLPVLSHGALMVDELLLRQRLKNLSLTLKNQ